MTASVVTALVDRTGGPMDGEAGASHGDLLSEVAAYYSGKLGEYGPTPAGVDWNSEAGQVLRFDQLARVIEPDAAITVNDLGCGYGAFLGYLDARHPVTSYLGVDVSADMVGAARDLHGGNSRARFLCASEPDRSAAYGFASGIFNVRQNRDDAEWLAHIHETIDVLDRTSERGFAFNCLTSYSDPDRKRRDLYYADPTALFDWCKRRHSRNVALLHDYDLYEFTILVRKTS